MPTPSNYAPLAKLPQHVALIMDGNNRWAKQRRLPTLAGHKAGIKAVKATVELAVELGIPYITLFAFSSENWQRPQDEVKGLMELFKWALQKEVKQLHKNGIKLRVLGELGAFSTEIQQLIAKAEALTADNTALTLAIAANYGAQQEITLACQQLAQEVADGKLTPAEITPEKLSQQLTFAELPNPDLCIRTSGEQRLSNFMLWQLAYSELIFTPDYWPAFRKPQFYACLEEFSQRQRRFGAR